MAKARGSAGGEGPNTDIGRCDYLEAIHTQPTELKTFQRKGTLNVVEKLR